MKKILIFEQLFPVSPLLNVFIDYENRRYFKLEENAIPVQQAIVRIEHLNCILTKALIN